MRSAETVLTVIQELRLDKNTGEPDDAKVSRPVRREAGGKGSS